MKKALGVRVPLTSNISAAAAGETAVKLVQEQLAGQKNAFIQRVGGVEPGIWLDSEGRQVLEFVVPVTWGLTGTAQTEEVLVRVDGLLGIPRLGEDNSHPAFEGFRAGLVQKMIRKRLPENKPFLTQEQALAMARDIYGLERAQSASIRYLDSRNGVYYVFAGFDGYGNRIDVFIHWVLTDTHHMFGYTEQIMDDTPCMQCHVVAG